MAAVATGSRPRRYRPPHVPRAAIRRYTQQIVESFGPDRIILFGSFAYGKPHADSDVDLLVIMAASNDIDQSILIRTALAAPFPLDLIVRSPRKLKQHLADGNWFLREIMDKGKVLYEKRNGKVGTKGRSRHPRSQTTRQGTTSSA